MSTVIHLVLTKRYNYPTHFIKHTKKRITCTYSKECSRKGQQSDISGFLQQNFCGTKAQQKKMAILDLSSLKKYLKSETFKMETQESIRTSLQTGISVRSIDFKDAYFHIPINPQSIKYLRFCILD